MISKETFIETMCALEILNNKMDKVDEAMKNLCPDFGGFYIPEVCGIVMNIFNEMFQDENDRLGYFVYECDYLNNCSREFNNWGDVYDSLIKNMEWMEWRGNYEARNATECYD